jgi:hypothetical protein
VDTLRRNMDIPDPSHFCPVVNHYHNGDSIRPTAYQICLAGFNTVWQRDTGIKIAENNLYRNQNRRMAYSAGKINSTR